MSRSNTIIKLSMKNLLTISLFFKDERKESNLKEEALTNDPFDIFDVLGCFSPEGNLEMDNQYKTSNESRFNEGFEILYEFKSGIFGTVFKVKEKSDQKQTAIKRIHLKGI